MANLNTCEGILAPGERTGAPSAIAAATLALEASRVGLDLDGLEIHERHEAIATLLGGKIEQLLATSPTLAEISARRAASQHEVQAGL